MNGIGKAALFIGGTLFGSAGFKILGSEDAKKVYVQTTAAALRVRDEAMTCATTVRENCDDILEEAKKINEERAAAKEQEVIEDAAAEA